MCGDSCIDPGKTCSKPAGCACPAPAATDAPTKAPTDAPTAAPTAPAKKKKKEKAVVYVLIGLVAAAAFGAAAWFRPKQSTHKKADEVAELKGVALTVRQPSMDAAAGPLPGSKAKPMTV